MPFTYYQPHVSLQEHIHSYWILSGCDDVVDVLFPDGCVDIIYNAGVSFYVEEKDTLLLSGKAYLGGALTEAIKAIIPRGVELCGVRVHPGCFADFYPARMLSDITNACIPVPDNYFPLLESAETFTGSLDTFYLEKRKIFANPVKNYTRELIRLNGNCNMERVAGSTCITLRQMERWYKKYVGLTPKQLSKILKFNYALTLIENKKYDETLLDIALKAGYYDHAHFSKEFKKIAGCTPSFKVQMPFSEK